MIEGLAWMAVANAALLLATHALLRRIRTAETPVNALLFAIVGLLVQSSAILLAGVTGALTSRALGLSGAALLLFLLIAGEHRFLRLPERPLLGRATGLLAGLIGVRMLAQVWFLAPVNGDALAYHLPKVAEWVRAGAFTREMGTDPCASFPAGFELIETWWSVFLHRDTLIEMAGVEFAALAFLAVRVLALSVGLSSNAASLASTLYILTPSFNLQATSCLNDGAVAALILALAAMIAVRAHPLLLILPTGLLLGIKATGTFALPGLILLGILRRKEPLLRPSSLLAALPLVAAAACVGSFWLIRNFLWYGNPIHPVTGHETPGPESFYVQTGPELGSLRKNLADLVASSVYDNAAGLTALSTCTAGWGIVVFSCGVAALISGVRQEKALRDVAAALIVSLLCVLLMVRNDNWFARFVMFFPAILCVAAARAAELSRPVALLVALGAALEFTATLIPQELPTSKMLSLMGQPWRLRSAAPLYSGTPPGDPIAVYAARRFPIYLLYGPDFSRKVVFLRSRSPEDLAQEMERQGLRFVYVNLNRRPAYDFEDLVRKGRFRALGEGYYALP
jgi:hypothetical protein